MPLLTRRGALSSLAAASLLSACGQRAAPDGILRVGLGGGPDSLDPLKAEYAVSALLFRQLFTPLVSYGPNGSDAPGIFASWQSAGNARKWTFKLAQGKMWSDGKPITLDDVLASFRRAADPKTAYPDISEFFAIEGVEAAAKGKGSLDGLGVKAVGADTLEFVLTAPDTLFPSVLREFYPLPTHALAAFGEKWTDPANFVGSGPFNVSVRTQQRLELVENTRFSATGPRTIKTISIEAIDEAATRARMFRAGDLDLVQDPPLNQLAQLKKDFGAGVKSFAAPRLVYVSFNTRRGPLANPTLRRALAKVIDRDVIAKTVFQDAVTPAYQVLRGPARYLPQGADALESTKAVLASLGISPATPLKLEISVVRDDRERAALLLADMWRPLGVEASIFGTESTGVVTKLNAGDFDVGITRIDKGLKSDPVDMLASFATGGTAQSHGWKNASFDQRLADARAEPDEARRAGIIADAESMLMQDTPIAPLWFTPGLWLVSDRVTGVDPNMQPLFWGNLGLGKKT